MLIGGAIAPALFEPKALVKQGYPAVMITDTAPNRYAHYHTAQDTPDKLSYPALGRVVQGVQGVVADLVR